MGWEDRPYYRERSGAAMNPLWWLLSGSVPMFTFLGIRVRAHAWLLVYIAGTILFDSARGYPIQTRALSMGILMAVLVLHEFGHCFMARWLGGTADEVLMWPLGGLAFADPPHRPLPSFLTSAAGPAVNVLICVLCAVGIRVLKASWVPLHPVHPLPPQSFLWGQLAFHLWWIYIISYVLLLFNLLPIFPLDGGQMTQAALWPIVGHYRSMLIATTTGMVGSVLFGILMLAHGDWWLAIMAAWLFYTSYRQRLVLRETGDEWAYASDYGGLYAAPEPPRRRRLGRRAVRRARKIANQEKAERQRIDAILAKVSAHGMHSLNWFERRALRKATERQRKRDLELSRIV